MAFTVTKKLPNGGPDNIGGYTFLAVCDVTFDTSYPTGGLALTNLQLGFAPNVTVVKLEANPTGGLVFEYDYTNKKLKAHYPTGGATAAPAALADPKVTTGASTASAVDATTPNITPGKSKEVLNTTNLSTIVARVVAIGCVI